MLPPRGSRRYLAVLAGLCLTAALAAATCGEPRLHELRRGGITVRRVTENEPARDPSGFVRAPGDFVLESPSMRVVVGGLGRGGEARGAILDALVPGAPPDDGIVLLAPRLYVGQRSYAVVANDMYVVERSGRPALRIDGEARVRGRVVDVSRELALGRVETALIITTRIATRDEEPLDDVRAGARIAWGGATPFLPGLGPLGDQAWHEAAWIGRSGATVSTTFAWNRMPLLARAQYEQHGASLFLEHTELAAPRTRVSGDRPTYESATLVLARGGLSESVRRLGWVRGEPFPELYVSLPYAPAGTRVQLLLRDGTPLVQGRPDTTGRVIVPITPVRSGAPPRDVYLQASAWGHAPSDRYAVVRAGARVRLEIPRGGRMRVTIVDADGHRIPARMRITGVDGTKSPDLGPEYRAGGALDAVITIDGDVTVPLEPGKYRVLVSRGPEWTLFEERVEVTETFRPHVEAALRHVVDPGEWVGCDFHLHAAPSPDSQVTLRDRVASLVAEGVRFAVATDHNHVTDYAPVIAEMNVTGLGSIPGVEVTTWDPAFGHFNAYPFPPDTSRPANGAPRYQGLRAVDLFDALHSIDPEMIVQVNHPRLEGGIGYFDVYGFDAVTGVAADGFSSDFDVLEVWNGFDLARAEQTERDFREWLTLVARGARVVATGNSDSHKVRYQWAGYPRTYVRVPGGAADDGLAVVRALREGRAFVTSGPFLEADVGGEGPGATVAARDGKIALHVVVRAPEWIDVTDVEIFVGGERTESITIVPESRRGRRDAARNARSTRPAPAAGAPVRFDRTIEVPVARDTFVVVRALGKETLDDYFGRDGIPPRAFTNPIFVDADGDGAVPWVLRSRRPQQATSDAGAADAGADDAGTAAEDAGAP